MILIPYNDLKKARLRYRSLQHNGNKFVKWSSKILYRLFLYICKIMLTEVRPRKYIHCWSVLRRDDFLDFAEFALSTELPPLNSTNFYGIQINTDCYRNPSLDFNLGDKHYIVDTAQLPNSKFDDFYVTDVLSPDSSKTTYVGIDNETIALMIIVAMIQYIEGELP